jgi:transposase
VESQLTCPRCGSSDSWALKSGRRRCARCRFDWRPGRWPLRLTPAEWSGVLRWFVRGGSAAAIAHETGLERKRVLRALTVIRQALARRQEPEIQPAAASSAGRDAPVIGLSAARGRAAAVVLPEADAHALRRAVRERRLPLRWDARRRLPYAAVVYRGRFYRLATSGGDAPPRFGELEAFWGYLRQQLRSRGGIRRERLSLYLAEYAWRYNNRRLSSGKQVQELATLVTSASSQRRPPVA